MYLRVLLTLQCPLNCSVCYVKNLTCRFFNVHDLPLKYLDLAISEFRPRWVCFGGGEPTCRIDLLRRAISICRRYGSNVEVTTSGFNIAELVKLSVDHVQLSVGSPSRVDLVNLVDKYLTQFPSFGFNVLINDVNVNNLCELLEQLFSLGARQVLLQLPRIFHVSKQTLIKYVAQLPRIVFRFGGRVVFDCLTNNVLSGRCTCTPTQYTYVLYPNGRLGICSTYPNQTINSICVDSKKYLNYLNIKNNT